MGYTNFPNGLTSFGIPLPQTSQMFTGTYWFVDPANGSDANTGKSPQKAFQTLYKAHDMAVAGRNDVVFLIGNGSTSATARLSLALAQSVDSSATSGTLNWTKNATHLIGVCAPTDVAQRARIAPPTGTYTQATFGSGNFVVVSAQGCYFSNISLFHGFSTGGNSQICWTDSGGRNAYENVNFGGIADAESAASTSARSLLVTGSTGENAFNRCTIGLDTVARSVANASVEFAAGTPRNRFTGCVFPFQTSNAGVLGILGTGAACMDRWQLFEGCSFINNIKSTSTQMSVLASLTNASPGGLLLHKNSTLVGITEFGDTNGLANSYVDGGAPTAASTGIAVNPS